MRVHSRGLGAPFRVLERALEGFFGFRVSGLRAGGCFGVQGLGAYVGLSWLVASCLTAEHLPSVISRLKNRNLNRASLIKRATGIVFSLKVEKAGFRTASRSEISRGYEFRV